jgi:CTP synthase
VGDIESLPFLEAIRQIRLEEGFKNTLFIHLTLVPYIETAGELKTKPTQHSVMKLREIGIQPDFVVCRVDRPLTESARNKIALFANLPAERVIEGIDVRTIYQIPLIFHSQGFDKKILEHFEIKDKKIELNKWRNFVRSILDAKDEIEIAVCGKYTHLKDAYKSIIEALTHAGAFFETKVKIKWIESETIEKYGIEEVKKVDGILIPGGFGHRGIEGKIKACKFARENRIPYFGICLGMQIAVIEFARNVLKLKNANSTEFDPETSQPVIKILPEKENIKYFGGTLRKGAYPCKIKKGTLAEKIYKKNLIYERHRHRYEFNPDYKELFERKGMIISGESPDGYLAEIIEIHGHPFFIGVQFHPEFKSRPLKPHPIFREFIRISKKKKKEKKDVP